MHTLTDDALQREPGQMLADAKRGEPALVTVDSIAVMVTVPRGKGLESSAVRIEQAAQLFHREQLSL